MTSSTTDPSMRLMPSRAGGSPVRADGRLWPVALGMLVLQVVWMLAVPPFRGIDEFDHAYRAASVASGDWAPAPAAATRGTGAWVEVPSDLVRAAFLECDRLSHYTGPEMCVGVTHGDRTKVASGAGRYHPLYYYVVGTAGKPFTGVDSLYAMRAASTLICWLLFVLALLLTRRWATTRWPLLAVVLASTPMLIYSSQVVAPNGVELLAAMVLWSALLGLASLRGSQAPRLFYVAATLGGCLLVTVRSLGPLWCLLIAVAVLIAVPAPLGFVRSLLRRRAAWLAAAGIGTATLASALWTTSMGSLTIGRRPDSDPVSAADKLAVVVQESARWFLQSIGAFPLRDQPTHVSVYAAFFLLGAAGVGWAFWKADRRLRLAMGFVLAASIAVPAVTTWQTFESYGRAWQGRYGLPFSLGLVLLAGLALERAQAKFPTRGLAACAVVYAVGQVGGPVDVLHREIDTSPMSGTGDWVHLSVWWTAVLAATGALVMWLGAVGVPYARKERSDA